MVGNTLNNTFPRVCLLQSLPVYYSEHLRKRMDALLPSLLLPAIRFVRREMVEVNVTCDAALAVSWTRIMGSLMGPVMGESLLPVMGMGHYRQ